MERTISIRTKCTINFTPPGCSTGIGLNGETLQVKFSLASLDPSLNRDSLRSIREGAAGGDRLAGTVSFRVYALPYVENPTLRHRISKPVADVFELDTYDIVPYGGDRDGFEALYEFRLKVKDHAMSVGEARQYYLLLLQGPKAATCDYVEIKVRAPKPSS